MYTDLDGILQIEKPFFMFNKFWDAYNRIQQNRLSKGDMVIHFRITTSGKEDKLNTHPHRIDENIGFVHNGILDIDQRSAKESDTVTLKKYILQHLPDMFLSYPGINEMLHAISDGSKLVFLDARMACAQVIHEAEGYWDNEIWYSNNSYKYTNRVYTYTYGGGRKYTSPIIGADPLRGDFLDDEAEEIRKEAIALSEAASKDASVKLAEITEIDKDATEHMKAIIDDNTFGTSKGIHSAMVLCTGCGGTCGTITEIEWTRCYLCFLDLIDAIESEHKINGTDWTL